jgi:hypothetical protein
MPKKVFTTEQAKEVAKKLGIDFKKWNVEQFRMGMDVELEHGKVDPHERHQRRPRHDRQDSLGAPE